MNPKYLQCMEEKGYRREKDQPYIYTRRAGDECYIVFVIKRPLSTEELQRRRSELEESYRNEGFLHVYHLCILCQKNGMFEPELMELVETVPNLWLFAEDQSRMYRYERQPMEFDGLCQSFEALPVEKGKNPLSSFSLKSVPWITIGLVLVNFFCFLFPVFTGWYPEWIELGENSYEAILNRGELYRLISSMFLHGDWNHLINNMIVLLVLGFYLEPALGRIQFCIIYFGSGVISGLFSAMIYAWAADPIGSIGASGAIFGLTGALLAMVLFWKGKIPGISLRRVSIMCIASLYGGFFSENVNNAAHIGGLIAGFILVIFTNILREKSA